jgi:membrane-associated phospholipid phosphatase
MAVALDSAGSLGEGLAWGFGTVALTAGLPSLDIYRRMRGSTVDDFHIFAREQRIRPLLVALACAAAAFGLSLLLEAPRPVQVCLLAGFVTGATLTLVTGRWKISFHAAGAASSLVLLVWALGWTTLVLSPLVPAVAWSRVRLGRHTTAQVAAGLLTGLALTILVVALY